MAAQDAADAELAALLGNWRDELRWPPATGLLSDADVMAAFNAGRAQKRTGPDPQRWTDTSKRNRRSLSVIGASAAAVLCIGGFGAVVAGSGPGDALYGVRTMLFGGQKQVRDDQIGLAAKTELSQVQTLISQGDWEQAQDKLVAVSTQVATIDDQQQKQELLDQFNDLSAKVVERDPAATAPPGVVYTVPPSSAALVPAVEPTSTPVAPASPTTSTTTDAPSTSTSPATTSPSPTSTSSAVTTTSAAPQTTTPTSASPSTTAAPPSPASSVANSADGTSNPAAPTSVATSPEAPRAASPTTPVESAPAQSPATVQTTAPAETIVSQTPPPAASTPAAESAPPSADASVPSAAVTTTMVPVPAAP